METALQTAASKYIGRWKHRLTLHFRVWPKYKETYDIIAKEKLIPINGIRINDDGGAEVWNQTHAGICGAVFEVGDDDFDVLTAIPKAGARMPVYKKMVVHTPGTTDIRIKKECWLEVPLFAYPDAAGAPTDRIVYFENDEDIDEDVICREVVEHDAMIVLGHRPSPGMRGGVSAEAGRKLMAKAAFWTVPSRQPWEDGGALRGYQFADRIVRWNRRLDVENREAAVGTRLAAMHELTREKVLPGEHGDAVRRAHRLAAPAGDGAFPRRRRGRLADAERRQRSATA